MGGERIYAEFAVNDTKEFKDEKSGGQGRFNCREDKTGTLPAV